MLVSDFASDVEVVTATGMVTIITGTVSNPIHAMC